MRVWVYLDVQSPDLQHAVEAAVSANFPGEHTLVPCAASDDTPVVWYTHPPPVDALAVYVSESQTLRDAGPIFMAYVARVPVLALCPAACDGADAPSLMECPECEAARLAAIDEFFTVHARAEPPMVVFEGGDGAGKQTQAALVVQKMRAAGRRVETLDFPHDKGLYGGLLRVMLSGRKGSIGALDPKQFSFVFSMNRYGSLPELRWWALKRDLVVLDRYYTANFGHQASKLPVEERGAFIQLLERLEVEWLGLPPARRVVYLDLPSKVALEAMARDATRRYLDIHETAGNAYKESVRASYLLCCDTLEGWTHIVCCDSNGVRKTREELNAEVMAVIG